MLRWRAALGRTLQVHRGAAKARGAHRLQSRKLRIIRGVIMDVFLRPGGLDDPNAAKTTGNTRSSFCASSVGDAQREAIGYSSAPVMELRMALTMLITMLATNALPKLLMTMPVSNSPVAIQAAKYSINVLTIK